MALIISDDSHIFHNDKKKRLKVYLDSGCDKKENGIKELSDLFDVEFMSFPFDEKSYDPKDLPEPKVCKLEDLEHVYFDDIPGFFDSPSPVDSSGQLSERFKKVRQIIGGSNKKDHFHYETALANGCQCIVSNDKDIYSHKLALEKINPILKVYQKGIDIYQEILRDFAHESFPQIFQIGTIKK